VWHKKEKQDRKGGASEKKHGSEEELNGVYGTRDSHQVGEEKIRE